SASGPFPGALEIADDNGAKIYFVHYAFDDNDGAAIIEWRRGGKLVTTQQVAFSRGIDNVKALDTAKTAADLDAMCPLHEVWDDVPLPSEVRDAPGSWEA